MKKVIKLAIIRKNDEETCPFGLPIPFGCQNVGKLIDKMGSFDMMGKDITEDEKNQISDANTRLLGWHLLRSAEESCKCKFAGNIIEEKKAVECNFNDTAPGESPNNLLGAPFYSQVFQGVGTSGLNTYPVGYYTDYNSSRNLFFGMYSLQGEKKEEIVKSAIEQLEKAANKTE